MLDSDVMCAKGSCSACVLATASSEVTGDCRSPWGKRMLVTCYIPTLFLTHTFVVIHMLQKSRTYRGNSNTKQAFFQTRANIVTLDAGFWISFPPHVDDAHLTCVYSPRWFISQPFSFLVSALHLHCHITNIVNPASLIKEFMVIKTPVGILDTCTEVVCILVVGFL